MHTDNWYRVAVSLARSKQIFDILIRDTNTKYMRLPAYISFGTSAISVTHERPYDSSHLAANLIQ